jgi:hypothetical protein
MVWLHEVCGDDLRQDGALLDPFLMLKPRRPSPQRSRAVEQEEGETFYQRYA